MSIFIAGPMRREARGLVIEPWALSAQGLTVPDACPPDGSLAVVEQVQLHAGNSDTLRVGLAAIEQLLCGLLAEGLQSRSLRERSAALAERLGRLELSDPNPQHCPAALLRELGQQAARLQAGEREAEGAALDAALGLLLFFPLARHALAGLESD
jgi:hypothetical protein